MSLKKKILSLFLAMILVTGSFCISVSAQETTYPMVNHIHTTTDDFATDEWTTALRGAYLLSGTSSISRSTGNYINISGATTATQTCDKIILTLYVERSTSYATGYSTYKSYHYTGNSIYQLVKEVKNVPVERGYYYRVKAVHSVTKGSTTETTNSVTNPISYI